MLLILKICITWPLKHYMKGQSHSCFLYFSLNWRSLSIKLVDDIFFTRFTSMKTMEKGVRDNYNVLEIIFKNCIIWNLNHCFKGPNHNFFYNFLLIWCRCRWNCCMIYFLLEPLTWKLRKKIIGDTFFIKGKKSWFWPSN